MMMEACDMESMKKMAKIEKLKELRKLMQKKMVDSMGSEAEGQKMLAEVLGDSEDEGEEMEESGEEEMGMPDPLKEEMKAFFKRGDKLPMNGKTKVMVMAAKGPLMKGKRA
jgi:hypothetical protein